MVSDDSVNEQARSFEEVLILVLMEDGLGQALRMAKKSSKGFVLILVLMEDGLGQSFDNNIQEFLSLNPCFNGRWSRTHQPRLRNFKR